MGTLVSAREPEHLGRQVRTRRTRAGGYAREIRAVDPGTWTRELVGAALADWTRLVGRAPRARVVLDRPQLGHGPMAGRVPALAEHRHCHLSHGTWTAGLHAAGLSGPALEHDLPRRERVASAVALRAAGMPVRAIAGELGVDLRTVYRYLAATTCDGCGGPALSGERCLECAPRNGPAATPEEICAALRAWATEHGAPPRSQDWTAASALWREAWPRWPGITTVLRVYGAWNDALDAAGLQTHRYAWDRDEALERLVDARTDPQLPGQSPCTRYFGSWNRALRASAVTLDHPAHWDDNDIHAILQEWASWHTAHHRGEPSAASYARWASQQTELVPSATSIRRRFGGSWNNARQAAGLARSRSGRPRAPRR